jgi:NADH-quinone oxidoreductase subunit J
MDSSTLLSLTGGSDLSSPSILQIILGTLTLIAALNVVLAKNPVVSAMSLMATLFLTGALYFGLGHYFIGAAQILIYAGAISVLFVFIIMLLDLKPSKVRIPGTAAKAMLAGVGGVILLAGLLVPVLMSNGTFGASEGIAGSDSAEAISLRFVSKYMLPFQLTGLLIFAAVMGAIIIARRHQAPKEEG